MILKDRLRKKVLILDGAMGTMLQAKGLKLGAIPEEESIENAETIIDIHREYIAAGAEVIYTNTFGANRYKLEKSKYTVEELVSKAVENGRKAVEGTDALVALDIGPIGQMLEPLGTITFEEAYDIFKEIIVAGAKADLIIFETMTDLYEVKAAVLAARENSDLPIISTMTFEENARTFVGVGATEYAMTIGGLGVDAIGVNCSLGPNEIEPVLKALSQYTNLPIVFKPNAGMPDPMTGEYDVKEFEFAEVVEQLMKYGVAAVGGCCGTTPEYIRELKKRIEGDVPVKLNNKFETAICSGSKTVFIDEPRIVGERINPTGKKRFKEALINNDIDYILSQAMEQIDVGAEILDVNVGLPEIDEVKMMVKAVKAIQGITNIPLQIDSTDPKVIEAALRVYNGKPILNSVSGKTKLLDEILPIIKKYNASVVGLTLDEDGIPKTTDKRLEIAKKILDKAYKYDIRKEDIIIDCLTLTVSAEQSGVFETLNGIKKVKSELGLKTTLGVSNISFGLPDRESINKNFLTMALAYGLDLPIINPNKEEMVKAFRAYKVLSGIDKNSERYIEAYNQSNRDKDKNTSEKNSIGKSKENKDLKTAVIKGMKKESGIITVELLREMDALDIVNDFLIPALDVVGDDFDKGKVFLPQLIQSAEAAQEAFAAIKKDFEKRGHEEENISKGKIIVATVKGDVHDIGKNITKVLLENYGYNVIDLGKDVATEAIIEAIEKNDCKLVGLSALMTTTLVSMKESIKEIRRLYPNVKVVVGGAVLTPDYAKMIDADFYAKDAKKTVEVAKKILVEE